VRASLHRHQTNADVIQRTFVCVSANERACINDCSNKLSEDADHQKELAFACV
jgi:hypothetical protein